MDHLRVVVQLKDADDDDKNIELFSKPTNAVDQYPMNVEVQLLGFKTVQLNLSEANASPATSITQKMNFDYVCHVSKNCLKLEISLLMDDLLLQRRDCSLMRFAAQREPDLTFLYNVLVSEINKRLHQLKASVEYVEVDYKSILGENADKTREAHNENAQKRCEIIRRQCRKTRMESICNSSGKDRFRSTRELLLWLLNRQKLYHIGGHDAMELYFSFNSAILGNFDVKFTLFHVYLAEMNAEERSQWPKFMEQLSGGSGTDFKYSELASCLRDHLSASSYDYILMLFDVPTNALKASDTIDLLQMAHAVVKNRTKDNLYTLEKPNARPSTPSLNSEENISIKSDAENSTTAAANHRSAVTIPRKSSDHVNKRKCPTQELYSRKDFSSLSSWYRNIDEKFAIARECMEKFTESRFNLKIAQIFRDIKALARTTDYHCNQLSDDISDGNVQETYNKYKSSLDAFEQMSVQVECSNYSEILQVYMETKSFELSQNALRFKIVQLERCQESLRSFIDDELCTYKLKLYTDIQNNVN